MSLASHVVESFAKPKLPLTTFFDKRSMTSLSIIKVGYDVEGPPGCVHGGATATMIDNSMVRGSIDETKT
jgi:hypothetical protein